MNTAVAWLVNLVWGAAPDEPGVTLAALAGAVAEMAAIRRNPGAFDSPERAAANLADADRVDW